MGEGLVVGCIGWLCFGSIRGIPGTLIKNIWQNCWLSCITSGVGLEVEDEARSSEIDRTVRGVAPQCSESKFFLCMKQRCKV